jgi:hypothetical protein
MKKYSIITSVAAITLSVAFAEAQSVPPVQAVAGQRAVGQAVGAPKRDLRVASSTQGRPQMALPPITGDPATDNQVRALQKEMEQKIQAIRTEYQAKIKAVIGDKKIIRQGTTTMMRGSSTMIQRPMMGVPQRPVAGQVKGASTEGGIRGFFNRLFGN